MLAPESFVLSQAFYVGGIKGQPAIKVIVTEGARIDQCDDLDDGAIFKNGMSSPTEHRQWTDAAGPMTLSDDDPRLLQECRLRVAGFVQRWGRGTMAAGDRARNLVQWLGDLGTRDGVTPSAVMIREAIRADFPQTTRAVITDMLTRRKDPRGCDVIDADPALLWADEGETADA